MMLLSNMILLSNMMLYDAIYLFKFTTIKLSNFCSIKRQIVKFEQANTHWELLYSCSVK